MKKLILFFVAFLTITSVTYASFPVTDPVIDPPIPEVVKSAYDYSGDFNWQAIVSVSCVNLAWYISWLFAIPGLVFGFLAIIGDFDKHKYYVRKKNLKWLGWIGLIVNALFLLYMTFYHYQINS